MPLEGLAVIDLSTGSVHLIPRLVAAQDSHGIRYLACPVSQGVSNARLGQLSIFVGGDREDYVRWLPLLSRWPPLAQPAPGVPS